MPNKQRAVVIAEKPSLMRSIKGVYEAHKDELPYVADFKAQAGHLLGLKMPKEVNAEKYGKWALEAFPQDYPYEYKINAGKNNLVKEIKDAIKSGNYDFIIHAGDPDQEGELLIRETLEYVGNKLPVMRFWTNDTTDGAILGALKNLQPDENYDHLYEAAIVRQHADYTFGMNCTGTVTCKTGDLCKLGRVKAPIVSILAERELEIQNYVEKKTYKPAFKYGNCEFVKNEAFETPELALKGVPATEYAEVKEAKYEKKSSKAPKLFKLSTLQTEAHKQLKWNANKTLEVLQHLYEAKAVSYPRTNCEYISSQVDVGYIAKRILREVDVNPDLLVREPSDVLKDKTYANDKAIASEGHTGIIPTGQGLSGSNPDAKALYDIICRRFLAMFGPNKETMSVKVTSNPSGSKDDYVFTESFDLSAGYEEILSNDYKMRSGCGKEFKNGETLHPIEFFAKELTTQKPSRYNSGTLISLLDEIKFEGTDGTIKYNIGTPATRANIIEECQKNGYFHIEKGSYVADEKAINLYLAFKDIPLFQPVESGRWEDSLDQVRKGKLSAKEVEDNLYKKMEESVQLIKDGSVKNFESKTSNGGKSSAGNGTIGECPNCKASVRHGQYGVYCSGKCGITFGKVLGHTMTDAEWKKALAGNKVHLKNLESKKTGKKYNAVVTPNGVEDFSYKKQDGSTANGKQMHFDVEFER